jgi:hypothetical protein
LGDAQGRILAGKSGDSVDGAIEAAAHAGGLAADLAYHVADARVRIVEALEFDGDHAYLLPWKDPFPYWFRRGDVAEETLELLERDIRIAWVTVEEAFALAKPGAGCTRCVPNQAEGASRSARPYPHAS